MLVDGLGIESMDDEDFQNLAAAVLNRMGNEPYSINKGIFEFVDSGSLEEIQTNLGQYISFDN